MKYLLDTDTFGEMVKGVNAKIVKHLETLPTGDAGLSVITRGEIAFGVQITRSRGRLSNDWIAC